MLVQSKGTFETNKFAEGFSIHKALTIQPNTYSLSKLKKANCIYKYDKLIGRVELTLFAIYIFTVDVMTMQLLL
jgi:hypothetical protein